MFIAKNVCLTIKRLQARRYNTTRLKEEVDLQNRERERAGQGLKLHWLSL